MKFCTYVRLWGIIYDLTVVINENFNTVECPLFGPDPVWRNGITTSFLCHPIWSTTLTSHFQQQYNSQAAREGWTHRFVDRIRSVQLSGFKIILTFTKDNGHNENSLLVSRFELGWLSHPTWIETQPFIFINHLCNCPNLMKSWDGSFKFTWLLLLQDDHSHRIRVKGERSFCPPEEDESSWRNCLFVAEKPSQPEGWGMSSFLILIEFDHHQLLNTVMRLSSLTS